MIMHDIGLGVKGRYKAQKYINRTFDEDGNILYIGDLVEETSWGDNLMTLNFFNNAFVSGQFQLNAVIGLGNGTPSETDNLLQDYVGYTATLVSSVNVNQAAPDPDGMVYWRRTYRWSFAPMSLGGGTFNIAEAGMVNRTTAGGNPTNTTPVISRGLLVDEFGVPTAISVNNDYEYLDLFWEYTLYVPAEVTGTITVDIDAVPTSVDYVTRPCDFNNTVLATPQWFNLSPDYIGGFLLVINTSTEVNSGASSQARSGPIGALTGIPTGAYSASNTMRNVVYDAYVPNSKTRTFTFTWTPGFGNIAGGVGAIMCKFGASGSGTTMMMQTGYTPKMPKDSDHVMDLGYRLTLANYP